MYRARIVGIFCIAISCEISRQCRDIVTEFHGPFAGSAASCSSSESATIPLRQSLLSSSCTAAALAMARHGRSAHHQVVYTCVTDHFPNHDTAVQRYCCGKSTLRYRHVVKSATIL